MTATDLPIEAIRLAIIFAAGLLVLSAAAVAIGAEHRRRSIIVRPWWRP